MYIRLFVGLVERTLDRGVDFLCSDLSSIPVIHLWVIKLCDCALSSSPELGLDKILSGTGLGAW